MRTVSDYRRLAQLALAPSLAAFIHHGQYSTRSIRPPPLKKCANLCMPVECHCHAILLSRRDTSDVVLTPQVMVVSLFALSLLPVILLPVVLRYVFPKFEVLVASWM